MVFTSIVLPYAKGYFQKLEELKAEERQKLNKKIEEKIEEEIHFEKDKQSVRLIIRKYIDRKFK